MLRKIPGTSGTDEAISERRLKSQGEEAAILRVMVTGTPGCGNTGAASTDPVVPRPKNGGPSLPCQWRGDTLIPPAGKCLAMCHKSLKPSTRDSFLQGSPGRGAEERACVIIAEE